MRCGLNALLGIAERPTPTRFSLRGARTDLVEIVMCGSAQITDISRFAPTRAPATSRATTWRRATGADQVRPPVTHRLIADIGDRSVERICAWLAHAASRFDRVA